MRGERMALLVKVEAGGGVRHAADLGLPRAVGDEVDEALLGLEGLRHTEKGGGLSAAFHKYPYKSVRPSSRLRTGPSRRPYGPPQGERYLVLPKDASP